MECRGWCYLPPCDEPLVRPAEPPPPRIGVREEWPEVGVLRTGLWPPFDGALPHEPPTAGVPVL